MYLISACSSTCSQPRPPACLPAGPTVATLGAPLNITLVTRDSYNNSVPGAALDPGGLQASVLPLSAARSDSITVGRDAGGNVLLSVRCAALGTKACTCRGLLSPCWSRPLPCNGKVEAAWPYHSRSALVQRLHSRTNSCGAHSTQLHPRLVPGRSVTKVSCCGCCRFGAAGTFRVAVQLAGQLVSGKRFGPVTVYPAGASSSSSGSASSTSGLGFCRQAVDCSGHGVQQGCLCSCDLGWASSQDVSGAAAWYCVLLLMLQQLPISVLALRA